MSRSLHALFTELVSDDTAQQAYAADPDGFLASSGHDLPADLVAEAVVSFADIERPEIAEHLAPFVMSHGPVGDATPSAETRPEALDGLALLANAPAGDDLHHDRAELLNGAAAAEPLVAPEPAAPGDVAALNFGAGSEVDADSLDAAVAPDPVDETPAVPADDAVIDEPAPASAHEIWERPQPDQPDDTDEPDDDLSFE